MTKAKKIVVGVDATRAGTAALEWAVRHAKGGTVLAVSVCRMFPEVCGGGGAFHAAHRRVLREAVGKLGAAPGTRIEEVVVDGEPGPTLVRLAEGADTLVLGGHEYQRADVAVIGSVVSYCLRHTTCPVVVVRPEADGDVVGALPHTAAREYR